MEGAGFTLTPSADIAHVVRSDVLIVPGGGSVGLKGTLSDQRVLQWIQKSHESAQWTASVCTGAMILGAAGLLKGLSVATHWRAKDYLHLFGATYSGQRITEHGKLLTAAGVSAGIDMGLRLCELIAGSEAAQAVQLSMEYDPEPPFNTGSPTKAPKNIVDMAMHGYGV